MTPTVVAVVGAGIVGCMIARELVSSSPGTSVVVLDRDTAGSGASRRSAGLHIPRGATDRLRRMTAYSQDYYEKLSAARPELPIHPVDMSIVTKAGDGTANYLDSAELTKVSDLPEVWRAHGAQYADVYGLTLAIATELRSQVSFRESVKVTAIEPTDGGIVLRLGTADTLMVDRLVLAPGPWLGETAWRELVQPVGARVKKIVALHVDEPPVEGAGVIVYQQEDAFLLPLTKLGYWLFSYTCTEWDVDPDTVTRGLSAKDIEEANDTLQRCAPDLAKRYSSARVFCDAYSVTGEPVVQVLAGDERIVFAGAANGCGYRLAPAIAAEVAALIDSYDYR